MGVDIASIGLAMDSRPVVEGTKALDALADSAARVEPKVDSAAKAVDGLGASSANVWRRGGEAQKAIDALGESSSRAGQRITVSNGQMVDTVKLLQAQAEQSKATAQANVALGSSTNQLTVGAQQFIEKMREQAATLGMSRAQLLNYQAAQLGVIGQTRTMIDEIARADQAMRASNQTNAATTASSHLLTDALKLLAAGYAALKVGEYVKDSALMAARYETLGVVMEVVGRTAGYTNTQMMTATESIAAQGITMLESRNSAIKLVQAHVDLSNASKIARIAQDAAVIGNINSSEAFERLVNGISRGNVLILRNIGINVNLQSAYAQMADSLGKTTKELSENERVQARLNAVLERGSDISGTYEAAMGTAGKQILSMQRYTQDLKTTFGEVFNEALTVGVMAITDNLKGANTEMKSLSSDGTLKQWGRDLTDVLVGVANAVSNVIVMTKLAAVEAAHAAGKDGGAGLAHPDSSDSFGKSVSKKWFAFLGASTDAGSPEAEKNYEATIAQLSGQLNKFDAALDARRATTGAKDKAAADAKLKVDQDYAKAATDILLTAASKGDVALAAAGKKVQELYHSTYVGTPTYRDTEGRDPKPKVDQAENTRLADHLKRIETAAAAEKAETDYLMKLDEMRHKAGELGDEAFYQSRRMNIDSLAGSEIEAYNKQLAELRAHHNNTEAEAEKNAKAINDVVDKKTGAEKKAGYELALLDEAERLRIKAVADAGDDAANKYIASLNAQVVAIEAANGKRQLSASVIAEEAAAQLRLAAAAMEVQAAGPADGGHTQADADAAKGMLTTLLLQAEAQERIAKALRDGEAATAARKLADQAIQDWKNVGQSIAESLSSAFGTAGKAAGEMFKAYADNASAQLHLNKELALAKKLGDDDPQKIKAIDNIHRQSAAAQLKTYGDMAGAAKGFFKENTTGYKLMEGAEKGFRLLQMANQMESLYTHLFVTTAKVGASATGQVAETGMTAAGEAARNALKVPGVFMSFMSALGPWGAAAAAVAIAAVLGGAFSGGGGAASAPLSEERQKTQGAGTVLGDDTAKSKSISNSLVIMEKNSSLELGYQNGMLQALRNIESALGGAAKGLLQTVGITGGSAFGTIASSDKSFFGASHTKDITDSGVKFSGSFGQLRAGQGTANQYEVIRTTSDGGMFRSGWTRDDPKYKALAEEAKRPFALIFDNMGDLLVNAGVKLGRDGASLTSAINSIGVNFEVSLRDLKGQELTDALNAGISVAFDKVTKELFPTIAQFQKMGEGLGETLVRVAADAQGVDSVFASMGKSLTTTVTHNMSSIGGWFSGIYNGVAHSVTVVTSMSLEAKERLVEASGGLDKFASSAKSFMQNFYSETEQRDATKAKLRPVLAQYGLTTEGPDAQKMFRNFILGLNASTEAGAATYATLMNLQQAFFDVTDAAASQRKDLRGQLDQLTLTRAQLLERERSALDASNRGLFDQIQAAQKAKDAQDAAKTSLGDFISKMGSFATSAKTLRDSLMVGSLTTLTPEQQYAQLRRQYESTLAAAKSGDAKAQGNYSSIATAFLTASQKINGGDSQYGADFASVTRTADEIAQWATGQVDVAQASLNALNEQVSGISTLNQTMLQMAQNIDNLPADLVATVAQAVLPVDYSRMGSSGNAELLAEVKALNTKIDAQNKLIDGLRADQQKQTGDGIVTNFQANQAGAETIVNGISDVVVTLVRNLSNKNLIDD